MPLGRPCGDLSIDGFFRTRDVSVPEIVAFEKRSHPGCDNDASVFVFTVTLLRLFSRCPKFSAVYAYQHSHVTKRHTGYTNKIMRAC